MRGRIWPLIGNQVQHVIKIFQALSLLTRGNNFSRAWGESLVRGYSGLKPSLTYKYEEPRKGLRPHPTLTSSFQVCMYRYMHALMQENCHPEMVWKNTIISGRIELCSTLYTATVTDITYNLMCRVKYWSSDIIHVRTLYLEAGSSDKGRGYACLLYTSDAADE